MANCQNIISSFSRNIHFIEKHTRICVCFFVEWKRGINMSEPKTIYCPKCGRKVATWDGRSTINISVKCKKCNKLVVYNVENENVEIKEIPQRATSSGMRFY